MARAVGSQSTGQGFESPILHKFPFLVIQVLVLLLLTLFFAACDRADDGRVDLDSIDDSLIFEYPEDFSAETDEQDIRDRWGEPESVDEVEIEGTESEAGTDRRQTLNYDGLQFIFYNSAQRDFEILAATVLQSDRYAVDLGLQVGMSQEAVEETLGQPDFVQDNAHVFSYGESPTDRLNIELIMEDDRVREIAISPEIP